MSRQAIERQKRIEELEAENAELRIALQAAQDAQEHIGGCEACQSDYTCMEYEALRGKAVLLRVKALGLM